MISFTLYYFTYSHFRVFERYFILLKYFLLEDGVYKGKEHDIRQAITARFERVLGKKSFFTCLICQKLT